VDEERTRRIAAALTVLDLASFAITIEGVGQFPSANGDTTLWAGVRECSALRELHAAIGRALLGEGVPLESRPYTPHITLARCSSDTPEGVVRHFLTSRQALLIRDISLVQFALYSSSLRDDVPSYRCEKVYPLR